MLITPVLSPTTMIIPTNASTAQPDLMADDDNILDLPTTVALNESKVWGKRAVNTKEREW